MTGQGLKLETRPQTTAKATIAANTAILAEPRDRRLRLSRRGSLDLGCGVGLKRIVSVPSRLLAEEAV